MYSTARQPTLYMDLDPKLIKAQLHDMGKLSLATLLNYTEYTASDTILP